MKTNQWIRLELFALAMTVVLPAVAQRKRPTKGKVTKVTITQPKAGNYRIDGMAPQMPMVSGSTSTSPVVRVLRIASRSLMADSRWSVL